MRTLLYDTLTSSPVLQARFGGVEGILTRVMPRQSRENILVDRPFLIYGLGNQSNEFLVDETSVEAESGAEASRQFFQVWVHTEGGSYVVIDDIIEEVKDVLVGLSSPEHRVVTTRWLETSQEFNNETYVTIFRYLRFQSIIARS